MGRQAITKNRTRMYQKASKAGEVNLKALLALQGPRSFIVEHGFLKERIIKYIDHVAVAANPRNPERSPDVLPGNQLHRFSVLGQNGSCAKISGLVVHAEQNRRVRILLVTAKTAISSHKICLRKPRVGKFVHTARI